MPELPEAEAARRRIEAGALNRTITGIELGEVTHVDLPDKAGRDALVGHRFTRTHRHGKYIFAGSKSGPWLHIHLGMSGSVRVLEEDADLPDYVRFSVRFEGGSALHFRDPRKFGTLAVIDDPEAFVADKGLGPDALQIGDNAFAEAIGGTKGAVKSALMAQRKLAGVGNLWSDEALFRTGIDPETRGTDLGPEALRKLHRATHDILQAVVDTDATYSELPKDWLIHRREAGRACPRCDGEIAKKKVGGRTAYHCPSHQAGA